MEAQFFVDDRDSGLDQFFFNGGDFISEAGSFVSLVIDRLFAVATFGDFDSMDFRKTRDGWN